MRGSCLILGWVGLSIVAGGLWAQENEPVAEAPIVALAMFKNGIVSVLREVKPPAGDAFLITDKIEPAHGTLWCTADEGFRLKTVSRTFEEPPDTPPLGDICKAYDGCAVTVTFLAATSNALASCEAKDGGLLTLFAAGANIPTEVTGTVVNPAAPEQARTFSRDYEDAPWRYYSSSYYRGGLNNCPSSQRVSGHLTLRLESGWHVSIPTGVIVSIRSAKMNTTTRETREVWRVEGARKPFEMAYLARGATWAPAYRLTLADDKTLRLAMSAIIRNEMAPFKDAEVRLVSGFPNIEFANRASLIVPGATIASFFGGLSRPQGGGRNSVMSQIAYNVRSPENDGYDLPEIPSEEASMDIHHRNIGKLTMDLGETLYLPLEQAETPCERVVEWIIPDRRDMDGYIQNKPGEMVEFWDTLRFRNPFKAPITTAPVEILEGTKLLGQSTITWVNPGQGASVKITKALSVSGMFAETEVDMKRPVVSWGGRTYRNPNVEGEFRVKNYRGIPVKVMVRLQMSGEYISASAEPTDRRLLETGAYTLNKRNEITWTLDIAPGEEQTVTYLYSVLVRH